MCHCEIESVLNPVFVDCSVEVPSCCLDKFGAGRNPPCCCHKQNWQMKAVHFMQVDKFQLPWEGKGGKKGSSALIISVPNNSIKLSQSALLLPNLLEKEKSSWCAKRSKWADFILFFLLLFVLVREGSGIWPACTVYYRYLSCWEIQPETVWNFNTLRFGLTKQEGQKKGHSCFHPGVPCFSVLQRSEQVEITACRLFQSLNQNSNVVFFYLFTFHTLGLGLIPQP